jgi:hypothetical protein
MKGRVFYILLIVAALVVVAYSPLTSYLLKDYITYKLEKALDMDIVFGKVSIKPPAQLRVSEIKVMDKSGLALSSERAYLQFDLASLFKAKLMLHCDFQNVAIKSGLGRSIDKLLGPFGIPAQPSYKFDGITGIVTVQRGSLRISGLEGLGRDFRFKGDFAMENTGDVDYNLEFDINKMVVGDGDAAQKLLVTDEDGDGWYNIKLSLKGDPHNPSSVYFSTGGIKLEVKPNDAAPKN